MHELIFTPAANTDLIEIARQIELESGSLETSERFVGRVIDKCEALAALNSILGRPRPELLPDLRSVPFGNYLIFIRYLPSLQQSERLEIVNILHARRDIQALFSKQD